VNQLYSYPPFFPAVSQRGISYLIFPLAISFLAKTPQFSSLGPDDQQIDVIRVRVPRDLGRTIAIVLTSFQTEPGDS